ncbi:hypothetical protein GCM10010912_48760 [Paenibacillus albidus]|uniref:Uncharacterized protein n=1 Tax=Paenibacillus albidus TaxID=2041023 RepID=A0A917CVF9_9BACL|nr:hypothetical protein [Paenibacillus albidus]GGF98319.1 hypothetical protein GCM10010912_48760 [Paenibacillus albidus]
MDQITGQRYLYYFIKDKKDEHSILTFEQWVYEHDELEEIFGEKEYFELISRNYKDKRAFDETEKQIRRMITFGPFEQERIILILDDLLTNGDATEQLEMLGTLYDEYCDGYNFLRYIALTYITTSDEYKEILKRDHLKFQSYMDSIRKEAVRLLGFLRSKEILIDEEHEYYDYRAEKDRIEIHSINVLLGN